MAALWRVRTAMLLEKNRWIMGRGRGGSRIARRARLEGDPTRFEIGGARFCSTEGAGDAGGAASSAAMDEGGHGRQRRAVVEKHGVADDQASARHTNAACAQCVMLARSRDRVKT